MFKRPTIILNLIIQLSLSHTVLAEEPFNPFTHIILGDAPTRYILNQNNDDYIEVTALGELSASGLYLDITELKDTYINDYPNFSWSWRVDKYQSDADISIKGKDDYAASLHFVFGKKSLFSKPKVLAYAWVGNDEEIGSVISSPRAKNHFRTIVLENKNSPLEEFLTYERNLIEDFKLAYGMYPEKALSSFGLFTDNDQTSEEVKSIYRIYINNESFN
ncbi:MAG: DUF3047 domain-containing protein [Pseudomonadota bacterium]